MQKTNSDEFFFILSESEQTPGYEL